MNERLYLLISAAIFGLVALGLGARLLTGFPILVGAITLPLWTSFFGFAVPIGVSAWSCFSKTKGGAPTRSFRSFA